MEDNPPDTKRFSFRHFESGRFYVYDTKYEEEFLVDMASEKFDFGECGCKEFRFRVEIKKERDFCVHIEFLAKSLRIMARELGSPPKAIRPPSFK